MRVKASQIRLLTELFVPGDKDRVSKALRTIFPEAFAWKKLKAEEIRTEPYEFINSGLAIHVFDRFSKDTEINVGVYRPGKGEQTFTCGDYVYRITEILGDGNFSVWRCGE